MSAPVKNRLAELRQQSRLTQKEVAKILERDVVTISRHENGHTSLSRGDIEAYARLYKGRTVELFLSPDDLGIDESDVGGSA